jgi:myosin heavy subunit
MDWLKELLKGAIADDQLETVIENIKKEFPKHAVPKSEFNTVNEELKIAKATAEQTSKTLEQLKTEAGTVEEYKSKLEKLNSEIETVKSESQKQVENIVKKVNFEKLLLDNKMAKSAAKLISDTYNLDEILVDSKGNIVEADKHIGKIKESNADLFIETVQNTDDANKNKDQKPPARPLSEMSVAEYMESLGNKGLTK